MPRKPAKKSKNVVRNQKKRRVSWKRIAASKKTVKAKKRAFVRYATIFSLFLFSLLFVGGFISYKKLTSQLASASSFSSSGRSSTDITSEDLFSIVTFYVDKLETDTIVVQSVSLSFVDNISDKIVTYNIAGDVTFDVSGRYGDESISNMLNLGLVINDADFDAGVALAAATIENVFGIKIDRYLLVTSPLHTDVQGLFNGDKTSMSLDRFRKSLKTMKTNLSLREFYYIYKKIGFLPGDRLFYKDFTKSYLQVPSLIDDEIRDLTFDAAVMNEKQTIAVLNGTDKVGLATFGERVIKNMGGRVIAVGNASERYERSVLIVDESSMYLDTVRELVSFFGLETYQVVRKDNVGNIYERELDRADIILIMGVDIANRL